MRARALLAGIVVLTSVSARGWAGTDRDRSRALIEQALVLANQVPDPTDRSDVLSRAASVLAQFEPRRALQIVEPLKPTHEQAVAMGRVAEALARENRLLGLATLLRMDDRSASITALARIVAAVARDHLDEAAEILDQIPNIATRRVVELEIAGEMARSDPGGPEAAYRHSRAFADTINDVAIRAEALTAVAPAAARVDAALAEEVLAAIPVPSARELARRRVVEASAAGNYPLAEATARLIGDPLQRGWALVALAQSPEAQRQPDVARGLLQEAAAAARELEELRDQGALLEGVARALGRVDPEAALGIGAAVWPPHRRYVLQCELAVLLAPHDQKGATELAEDAWVEVRRQDAAMAVREIAQATLVAALQLDDGLFRQSLAAQPELTQTVLPAVAEELAATHPDLARRAAEALADPVQRELALSRAAVRLAERDTVAAEQWEPLLQRPEARASLLTACAAELIGLELSWPPL